MISPQSLLPELLPAVPALAVDRFADSDKGFFPAPFLKRVICRSRSFLFIFTFMLFPLCWLVVCVSIWSSRAKEDKGGLLWGKSLLRALQMGC